MSEQKQKKSMFSNLKLFQKIKGIKHIEIIVVVIFVCIILLIYFSSFSPSSSDKTTNFTYTNVTQYTNELENKLKDVIGSINGAGNVSVMVTVASGIEYVYASSTEEKVNSNSSGNYVTSSSTTTSTPINGIIVKEILPEISGVVVVSSGAGSTNVKLEILRAVQAVLGVSSSKVEIIVGK